MTSRLLMIEEIQESWDLCTANGIVDKLSKKMDYCKRIVDKSLKSMVMEPSSTPFQIKFLLPQLESLFEKCDRKGVFDDISIKTQLSIFKQTRGERCYRDLVHCILVLLELNGDLDVGTVVKLKI